MTNVRRGDGVLLADLLFTTRRGIELVRNGKRGVSVGYDGRRTSRPDRTPHGSGASVPTTWPWSTRPGAGRGALDSGDSAKGGAMRTRDETCSLGRSDLRS